MYRTVPTKQFIRSLTKLERSGLFTLAARKKLNGIINLLAQGKSLSSACKDHPLRGDLHGHRECHIKGDLLLLYELHDETLILVLADIGTHSQLFG